MGVIHPSIHPIKYFVCCMQSTLLGARDRRLNLPIGEQTRETETDSKANKTIGTIKCRRESGQGSCFRQSGKELVPEKVTFEQRPEGS